MTTLLQGQELSQKGFIVPPLINQYSAGLQGDDQTYNMNETYTNRGSPEL